jgi:hypothetical protein
MVLAMKLWRKLKKTLNVIVVFNSNKRYDNNLHPKQPWGMALTKYQEWQ